MSEDYALSTNTIPQQCQFLAPGPPGVVAATDQNITQAQPGDDSDGSQASTEVCQVQIPLPPQELSKHDKGWRRIVRNFTPSWFSVTMGTGMVSTLLSTLPYNGRWLYWLSVVIFVLNVFLFAAGCIISILRYILYPETFKAMITHPVQSMFMGTFPMGLATIINMTVFVCVPVWGEWAKHLAWALWIFDAWVSVMSALSLPFLLMSYGHVTQLSSMTAVWLLPVVTCTVSAGTGAIVADILPNAEHALWTIIVSYVLWGIGFPLAMMIYVIYFQRLTFHKIPPKEVIVSVFLPMGPVGSGSYSIMRLGAVAREVFPKTGSLDNIGIPAASILYINGFMIALILWAFGLVWLFFASASILRCRHFPFNIGWWGFTFPLGAYAMGTCRLGKELPSVVFDVLGTILSLLVVILWIVVSIGTLKGVISGRLFVAPCLAEMNGKQDEEKGTVKAA